MGFRYIGSKVRIAEDIIEYLGCLDAMSGHFVDAFAGTGAVASAAADRGWSVRINPTASAHELSIVTNLTIRAVEKNLRTLRESGRLRNVGPTNGGHWEVLA